MTLDVVFVKLGALLVSLLRKSGQNNLARAIVRYHLSSNQLKNSNYNIASLGMSLLLQFNQILVLFTNEAIRVDDLFLIDFQI